MSLTAKPTKRHKNCADFIKMVFKVSPFCIHIFCEAGKVLGQIRVTINGSAIMVAHFVIFTKLLFKLFQEFRLLFHVVYHLEKCYIYVFFDSKSRPK